MSVLVDTSVWSLALRRKPQDLNDQERALVGELTGLIKDDRVKIIGLIRQEVLSGVKVEAQFERLRRTLGAFRDEPVDTEDHEAAAKAANQCRAKGIAVSVVDILICVVAQRRGLAIFSTDPDFSHYNRVLTVPLHSVARPSK